MTQKYDARGVTFAIEDPNTPGTWVTISGINTFTKSSANTANTDTTTFASGGEYEGQMMQRGKTLKIAGFRLIDPATAALDPGQALVEALAAAKSDDSLGSIRFAHEDDTEWEVWTAYAELDDVGGGNNDKVSWGCTFTKSGASTTAAKS